MTLPAPVGYWNSQCYHIIRKKAARAGSRNLGIPPQSQATSPFVVCTSHCDAVGLRLST